jgi:hypothetical protein
MKKRQHLKDEAMGLQGMLGDIDFFDSSSLIGPAFGAADGPQEAGRDENGRR